MEQTPVVEPPREATAPSNTVMDVKPPGSPGEPLAMPPPEEAKPEGNKPASSPDKAKPQKPDKVKQPNSNVAVAIIATVIIVLSLAALATYAYVKTK